MTTGMYIWSFPIWMNRPATGSPRRRSVRDRLMDWAAKQHNSSSDKPGVPVVWNIIIYNDLDLFTENFHSSTSLLSGEIRYSNLAHNKRVGQIRSYVFSDTEAVGGTRKLNKPGKTSSSTYYIDTDYLIWDQKKKGKMSIDKFKVLPWLSVIT